MKKTLLQLSFVFLVGILHSQTYKPLVVEGNRWNVLKQTEIRFLKCLDSNTIETTSITTEVFKISTDTTIGETVYKKLVSQTDTSSKYWNLVGFIREDIAAQQVYFKEQSNYNIETLLYDFSVNIKETVDISYYSCIVDTIDSITINNELHKRIRFTNEADWIEGVGAINGLITSIIPRPLCGPSTIRTLLCSYNNNGLLYITDNKSLSKCFYWGSVDEGNGVNSITDKEKFEIFPNPASDYITITSENEHPFTVEVLSAQGYVLSSEYKAHSDIKIDLRSFVDGIYYVRILNDYQYTTYKLLVVK